MMECPKLVGVTHVAHALFFVYTPDLDGACKRVFDRNSVLRTGIAKNLTAEAAMVLATAKESAQLRLALEASIGQSIINPPGFP